MRESAERLAFRDTAEGRAKAGVVVDKIRATLALDDLSGPLELPAADRTRAVVDKLRARLKETHDP